MKSIEEPPPGYHFIFCAEREEALLPTIISRCVITRVSSSSPIEQHEQFLSYFIQSTRAQPAEFLQSLGKSQIDEQKTTELLDALLSFWIEKYKKRCTQKDSTLPEIEQRIETIKTAMLTPPMPGSSKIFWRDLFLQLNSHL